MTNTSKTIRKIVFIVLATTFLIGAINFAYIEYYIKYFNKQNSELITNFRNLHVGPISTADLDNFCSSLKPDSFAKYHNILSTYASFALLISTIIVLIFLARALIKPEGALIDRFEIIILVLLLLSAFMIFYHLDTFYSNQCFQ